MSRARAVVYGAGLAGLVAVLTPLWAGHALATRLATRRRSGGSADIPRRLATQTTLDEVFATGRPAIIEGLVDQLALRDVATPSGLLDAAGDQSIDVAVYDARAPFFLYSGGYDTVVRSRRTMPFGEFAELMFENRVEPGSVIYQLFGINSLHGAIRQVLERFDGAVRSATDRATEPRFSGVWIGSTGATTPLHHDAWPGLLFQTYGTKRVAMYAPGDRSNLYFRSPLRGAGRWSDLPGRSGDAPPADFPRLARAVRHVGTLEAGDALYIPPFWAHEIEAMEANISVPFRFAGSTATYLDPGFLRPATEMLREQVRRVTAR